MSDAVLIVDKFLLCLFGCIVYHYGYDFCKTMIWDEDKIKTKGRREWNIDNSLIAIHEHITEMNEKLTDILEKVTLLEENTLFHIPEDKKFSRDTSRDKVEYDDVDFGVHTPEVRSTDLRGIDQTVEKEKSLPRSFEQKWGREGPVERPGWFGFRPVDS